MNSNYLEVSYQKVFLSFLLILINCLLSIRLNLKMEKSLFIASLRTIVQLLTVAHILQWIFEASNPLLVIGAMIVMTTIAGISSVGRVKHRYPGIYLNNIMAIFISVWPITFLGLLLINPTPWYLPQYTLPLIGMILGNSLNGISLAIDRFIIDLNQKREEITLALSLGATSVEATRPLIQEALRSSLTPTINSMMVMGIVSLPGMMTGQLISGVSPISAVKYQLILMFLIATSTFMGSGLGIWFSFRKHFNRYHQLETFHA